jgi:hypothetical protein
MEDEGRMVLGGDRGDRKWEGCCEGRRRPVGSAGKEGRVATKGVGERADVRRKREG